MASTLPWPVNWGIFLPLNRLFSDARRVFNNFTDLGKRVWPSTEAQQREQQVKIRSSFLKDCGYFGVEVSTLAYRLPSDIYLIIFVQFQIVRVQH